MVSRLRAVLVATLLGGLLAVPGAVHPPMVGAAEAGAAVTLTAYLDGKPIPLKEVSKYFCDDFAYPVITCSASALISTTRSTLMTLLTSVEYATIYDNAFFGGAWMNVSQDYSAFSLIGWNDRVSSFKSRNSETGVFYTDWFWTGSQWSFCCNQQLTSLGAYDNTFSSIRRT